MTINGKPIAIRKVDAATVQFVAPDPYYALPIVLASVWGIGHHARFGRDALGGFAPAHYLKQFHPEVHVQGRHRQEGRRGQRRQLGDALQEPQQRLRQPGPAGRDAVEDDVADQHAALHPRAEPVQHLGGQRREPAALHRPDPDDARREPRDHQPAGDRRRVRLAGAPHRHRQAAGAAREPAEGRLPRLPRSLRPGGGRRPDVQPELREGRRRSRSGSATREFRIALSHGIDRDADQRDVRAGARPDRVGGAGRADALLPGPGVQDAPHAPTTSRRRTRCSTSSGWTRRTPRGTACGGRRRPAPHGPDDLLGFLPVHPDRRDGRRALEEDRDPGGGPGARAGPGDGAARRQRAPDLLRDPVGRRQHVRARALVLPGRPRRSRSGRSTGPGTRAPGRRARRRRRGCGR